VVLTTIGGTPAVYSGDKRGLLGLKKDREGGDDEIRPTFPATPAELPPRNLSVFHLHRELLGLRRDRPWLHRARTTVLDVTKESLS
jgi:cyclomaltodextrinase